MNSEQLFRIKERPAKPAQLLFYIHEFDNFHNTSGGSQGQLKLVLESLTDGFPDSYQKTVLVNKQCEIPNTKEVEFDERTTLIANRNKTELAINILRLGPNHDIFHIAVSTFTSPEKLLGLLMLIGNKPVIMRLSSNDQLEKFGNFSPQVKKIINSRITRYISQSDELTTLALQCGIPQEKIEQVTNVVDTDKFQPLADKSIRIERRQSLFPQINEENTVFIYSGRISEPSKNAHELIKVWTEKEFYKKGNKLILLGPIDPKKQSKLIENFKGVLGNGLLKENNQFGIYWAGVVPHEQVVDYLQIADVYVSPSSIEGLSNSGFEAAATGLPCIGRRGTPGNNVFIREGQTGGLFSTPEELGNLMCSLQDQSLRKIMGSSARDLMLAKHSKNKAALIYHKIYQSLL